MRKIEIAEATFTITFEGTQYPPGVWLVTDKLVVKEPDCYVYFEDEKRVEVEAGSVAGVVSTYTAGRLAENWPDFVLDVRPPKKRSRKKAKAE